MHNMYVSRIQHASGVQNHRNRRSVRHLLRCGLFGLGMIVTLACNDLTGSQNLPAGTSDPALFRTEQGARGMYDAAVQLFREAMASVFLTDGQLTDELESTRTGGELDARRLGNAPDGGSYVQLQMVRGQARQARGALALYAPDSPSALRGELYAYEGYAEIMLADLFCSGIPLSTLDFEGDFTYKAGSTTTDVYQHAITLFDSALALSTDSVEIQYFAQVGKARALLDLGQYALAATTVANVPTGFQYQFAWGSQWLVSQGFSVSNMEGGRGLPYRTGGDARVAADSIGMDTQGKIAQFVPRKYLPSTTLHPWVVASGIEARLIEAEAALHDGDIPAWMQELNDLRAIGGTYASPTFGALPALSVDSTINAADTLRVNVLFHERAYWLFVTGQRQGDLRRLIRQYHRVPAMIYPSQGTTQLGTPYGTDVVLPIIEGLNPLFKGCLSYDA